MRLVGATSRSNGAGIEELPGKVNYFIGNDPKKWHANVPTYARVRYRDVYPGVSLIYYGSPRRLEYDFAVAPGADPRSITLAFEGSDGVRLDAQGHLVLQTVGVELRLLRPLVYQEVGGVKQRIPARYVLKRNQEVGFDVSSFDASRELIIDPVLYSTYLGGSLGEGGWGIALDGAGSIYVVGRTSSIDFPTANALQGPHPANDSDAFVAKLNPTGSALVYSTYLGGSGFDKGEGIAVDADGNAYVTGQTGSPDFPTANPVQAALGGDHDAFVAKLNATGSALMYSTYLGGLAFDKARAIAVDAGGNAYVMGATASPDFPTVNPFQATLKGGTDAFVAKLNPTGSALVYSTYLGGSGLENFDPSVDLPFAVFGGIAVDAGGNAYVTGATTSSDFPTVNPFQATLKGGTDAFVAKLNPTGSALVYSTYLGGGDFERASGIAVDAGGNAYVTGVTASSDFPTANPLQANLRGGTDAFVTKLNPTGSALVYSTYLGGSGRENFDPGRGFAVFGGIAVDAGGNAYVAGVTGSPDFPTANPFQSMLRGTLDAFVAKLDPIGSTLVFSTYLGGPGVNVALAIAADAVGNVGVTGAVGSLDFPTVLPFQPAFAGGDDDVFVIKLTPAAAPIPTLSEWALIGMALLLLAIGLRPLRSFGGPR